MKDKLGFGIIGAGMIAGMHAASIRSLDNCELAGFFDPVPEAAKKRAEEFGCRAYPSLEAMLADPEVRAVTIATPSGLHGGVAVAAAKAGKHIFCEKPLEVDLEKTDAVIATCEENHVLLAPVFQIRFTRPVQLVRDAVERGRFGRMLSAGFRMHWFRSQEYYDSSKWRGTWSMDGGGALMNQAIHMVDLLLYLNGEPEEVFAYAGTFTHQIEVEDNLCAAIRYRNGSFGTIDVSTSCEPGYPRRMELVGTRGRIAFEEDALTAWDFLDKAPEDEEIRRTLKSFGSAMGSSSPSNIDVTGHAIQLRNLADAVLSGKPLLLDGREGRRAVELVCGIYDSVRSGKPHRFAR